MLFKSVVTISVTVGALVAIGGIAYKLFNTSDNTQDEIGEKEVLEILSEEEKKEQHQTLSSNHQISSNQSPLSILLESTQSTETAPKLSTLESIESEEQLVKIEKVPTPLIQELETNEQLQAGTLNTTIPTSSTSTLPNTNTNTINNLIQSTQLDGSIQDEMKPKPIQMVQENVEIIQECSSNSIGVNNNTNGSNNNKKKKKSSNNSSSNNNSSSTNSSSSTSSSCDLLLTSIVPKEKKEESSIAKPPSTINKPIKKEKVVLFYSSSSNSSNNRNNNTKNYNNNNNNNIINNNNNNNNNNRNNINFRNGGRNNNYNNRRNNHTTSNNKSNQSNKNEYMVSSNNGNRNSKIADKNSRLKQFPIQNVKSLNPVATKSKELKKDTISLVSTSSLPILDWTDEGPMDYSKPLVFLDEDMGKAIERDKSFHKIDESKRLEIRR